MKRIIYILAAALVMLTGCEYHPYYDGQKFCVYFDRNGLIETDGEHIYVPVVSTTSYSIECYGGLGENYSLEIADPQYFQCTFIEKEIGGLAYDEPEPARFVIEPKQIGDTEMTITDNDTGESIQIYVHICEAYHSIEVTNDSKIFNIATRLVFKYGGTDDVLKVLMPKELSYQYEVVAEGTYEFVNIDDLLYLEMTLPLDSFGTFSPSGTPTFKRFQVQYRYGGAGHYSSMLADMNLTDFQSASNDVEELYHSILYVDVTGVEDLGPEGVSTEEYDYFAGSNAHLYVL